MSWGKFSKDPMKKQQETMKLYNKAGVNPMAGCIPGLMQAPIFYALFQFFPSAISLRQKDFFGQMIYLLSTPFMSYHVPLYVIILVCHSGLNSDFLLYENDKPEINKWQGLLRKG
jgi:YidC/Oxa1 family membrane protein insertase